MPTREEITQRIKDDGIRYLLAQFVDMQGSPKVKMVPANCLDDVLDTGAGFAGAAVWGMGQGPHSHDMLARIDLDTYTPLPWAEGVARFASDLYVDDEPHPFCPRVNLKRVLGQVRGEGYVFNVGVEPEHFLVVRNPDGSIVPWDPTGAEGLEKPCYDFKGLSGAMAYLQEMMDGLNGLGWDVYQSDHEDANGQYEINFVYTDALTTADRHTFFKMMSSQVAQKYGAISTFMAKPFGNRTGSGAHIHFHLADSETGENIFLDESDPRGLGLSTLAYNFIGGIFQHAQALCGVTSPTVNCYKRLQVGSALVRVSLGLPVDTRLYHLRRQQPHPDGAHRWARPFRRPHYLRRLQPLSRIGSLPSRWAGRHPASAGPRRTEPRQYVRRRLGGNRASWHPAAAPIPPRSLGPPRAGPSGPRRAGPHRPRIPRPETRRVATVPPHRRLLGSRPLPDTVLDQYLWL